MVLHCVTHATQHPHPLPPLPEGEGKRGRHSPGVPLAVDALGNISTASGAVCDNADCAKQILPETLQVYQHTLPALVPPAGLQAEAQAGGRIALSWERVAEAEAYQLYCGTTADTLTACGSPVTTAATTDQPGSDGVYYYAVTSLRAANGDTAESDLSAVVSATADATQPETPDGVEVEQRVEGMYITWSGPAYSEEVAYTLYRATASDVSDLAEVSEVLAVQGGGCRMRIRCRSMSGMR